VLGNIVIGENCRVGAGSVVLRSVPENSTVVGVPARIVYRNGKRVVITAPKEISDPLADVVASLVSQLQHLRRQIEILEDSKASESGSILSSLHR
jgi:serine O-acetyltransferase